MRHFLLSGPSGGLLVYALRVLLFNVSQLYQSHYPLRNKTIVSTMTLQ